MTVWVCEACTASYSVGALRCPQCGANVPRENGDAPVPASAYDNGIAVSDELGETLAGLGFELQAHATGTVTPGTAGGQQDG